MSRPGRIKYHYKYQGLSTKDMERFCEDNLKRKELTDEVINALNGYVEVSMDMIKALVDELNMFDCSVSDAVEYLNFEKPRFDIKITGLYKFKPNDWDKMAGVDNESNWDENNSVNIKRFGDTEWDVAIKPIHVNICGYWFVFDLSRLKLEPGKTLYELPIEFIHSLDPHVNVEIVAARITFIDPNVSNCVVGC